MKIPIDKEAHLKKAEEYKIKIENGEDSFGDYEDSYLFHLTQAGAWNILIDKNLESLERMKTSLSEEQFYSNSNAFRLIYSLNTKYEKAGDKKNAKKMFLELLNFREALDFETAKREWDFSTIKPKDLNYEKRILELEKEFEMKKENPLKNRRSIGQRMKQLGDLALKYDYADNAIDFYLYGAKQLEPYVYNVKYDFSDEYNLLRIFYFNVQHFQALKQLFIWRYSNTKKEYIHQKAIYLTKIGFINSIQKKFQNAEKYYILAAHYYLDFALKYSYSKLSRKVYNTCRAIFLFNRANKPDFISHYSKSIIPGLKELYHSKEIINSWVWGEYLKRIYKINNQEKEAKSIVNKMITNNEKDIEIISVNLENDQKNIIKNYIDLGFRYLSLGFCEEFLINYESSMIHFEKTEEYFNLIFNLRKDIWDHIENLDNWNLMIKLCQCIKTKIELKMKKKKSINIKKYVQSFLQLTEITDEYFRFFLNGFNGIVNEEQYDYYKLLIQYDPDIFNIKNYDHWNLYYKKDEVEFLKVIKEERKKHEKPKDMEKAIKDFKLKITREGWPQIVINEIMKLYYQKNFDITEWPEDALIGFKMVIENNQDLDFIYSEGYREDSIIGILIAIGKGVIKV
jgi:hypothetical protein